MAEDTPSNTLQVTCDSDTSLEIWKRILAGNRTLCNLRKLQRSGRVSSRTKLTLYRTLIRSVVLYGHDTWTLLDLQRRMGQGRRLKKTVE